MKVVFAPWVRGAEGVKGRGVEFEITAAGVRAIRARNGDGKGDGGGAETVQGPGQERGMGEGMIDGMR